MTNRTIADWLALPVAERHELARASLAEAQRATDAFNTFISIVPDAELTLADDGELASVPFAVKDNVDVAGLPTTAGTATLAGHRPKVDSSLVHALRDAGAAPIAKANLHEMAFGLTSNNATYGPARNPRHPDRTSGGSSGGSAAAVASGVVPFALGTDTGASVTTPSGYCGVVGFRPSTGRYPGDGLVHLTWTRDAIGTHANSVADVRLLDRIITRTSVDPGTPQPRDLTIGLPQELFADLDPEVGRAASDAICELSGHGVRFVDVSVPRMLELAGAGFGMVFYETPINLKAYLGEAEEQYQITLAEFADRIASPDVRDMFALMVAEPIGPERYEADATLRNTLRALYQKTFATQGIDVMLYPTSMCLPPLFGSDATIMHNGTERDMFPTATRNVAPGGLAGAPQLTLPLTRPEGALPIAVTIEGGIGTDDRVLAIGEVLHNFL